MNPERLELYLRRRTMFQEKQDRAQKASNGISWLRLIFFILAAGAFGYGFYGPYRAVLFLALPLTAIFVWLIVKHIRLKDEMEFLKKMVQINITAGLRLEGKWTAFTERGDHYADITHPYTTDLNIFGQGSLFQYINATTSFRGERLLADMLSRPAPTDETKLRQEAVSEMADCLDFRQSFQAAGMDPLFKQQDSEPVQAWAQSKFMPTNWATGLLYMPVATFTLFGLGLLGLITYFPAVVFLVLQIAIALPGERKALERFTKTDKAVQRLKRYEKLMRCIEEEDFKSSFLIAQKKRLFTGERPASRQVRALVNIADRNNLRFSSSMVYFILKFAVLWDKWTLKMLDDWQKSSGKAVGSWFEATAEVEVLSSLAGLYHDNRHWVFPQVDTGIPAFHAIDLGHPLIPPGERVGNDTSLMGPGRFFIITGSNMSGKSTFLRTVGINLALAYAGAPVCAREFACSMMQVYSKMQIHDSLEERVSTFYGELIRMKMIIDAAQTGAPLIILLDEIFRGTNPRDRIFATRTIIRQLHKLNVIGLVTTHDHELGELEKEYTRSISNYHFTDEIRDGNIHFDYKIKPGIAQTANAVALMKLVGIEVEENDT